MNHLALTGRARLADDRAERKLRHLADEWIALPLGDVTGGDGAQAFGTATFTTYAAGGVTIVGTTGAADVAMVPWTDGAGSVYLFKWNAGTSKMMVTDWAGTELAAGADISDASGHPYRAILSSVLTPRAETRLTGAGKILEIEFEVAADFTASTTNYWTLTAYLRRMDAQRPQEVGETLGSYSTQKRTLVAQKPVALYTNVRGTPFGDSDRVSIVAAKTGNPGALLGANAWIRVARAVG